MRKLVQALTMVLVWAGLAIPVVRAQTCPTATSTLDYNTVATGDRKTGSDVVGGTSVTYSNYSSSVLGGNTNTFAVGSQAILSSSGNFLVWQQDDQGLNPGVEVQSTGNTSNNRSFVTLTFSRPVANLTLRMTDIDLDRTTANFIDRVTFDGYATTASTTPITLGAGNFVLGTNNVQKFVGSGYTQAGGGTTNTNPVARNNAVTGIATSTANRASDLTVTFPSAVTKLVLTYENIAPYVSNTTGRTQTIGFVNMTWCRFPPVPNPITTSSIANTAGAVPIPTLSATTDGSVQYYTLTTLPPASQGILYVNGTAATLNQRLTPAQAAALTFAPASTFSGNAGYTYSVTDDANVVSVSTAPYTIPVTAAGGPGTPAPCASVGKDGPLTTTATTGVLNTYYPGTGTPQAGTSQLTLGAPRGSGQLLAANDLVLIIQMQGGDFNYDNSTNYGTGQAGTPVNGNILSAAFVAGQYEYAQVASVSGSTITLSTPLTNSYYRTGASSSSGRRNYQVVRVPQYTSLTLGANVVPSPWNGTTGGIVALDVAGQLALSTYSINASGTGFRGGAGRVLTGDASTTLSGTDYRSSATFNTNGTKGEGTVGTPRFVNDPSYSTTAPLDTRDSGNPVGYTILNSSLSDGYPGGDNGRGAPGNAGGGGTDANPSANDQNAGGGGGANGGAGGRGGNSWSSNQPTGGEPGAAFLSASSGRLVMGGGGGSGCTNNGTGDTGSTGFASSGASGGGIVLVRTGTISGTGSILADGSSPALTAGNDSGGGGGAGGSILVTTATSQAGLAALTLSAKGGNGGSNTGAGPASPTASAHGPGGGGGGGIIFASSAIGGSSSVAAGTNGTTQGPTAGTGNFYNSAPGSVGTRNTSINRSIDGSTSGANCLTEIAASITGPTTLTAGQVTGVYTATFTNEGPQDAPNVTQTVTLPTGASLTAAQQQALITRYGLTNASFTITGSGASAVTVIDFGTATTLVNGAANAFSFAFTAPAAMGTSVVTANTSTSGNEALNVAPNSASLTLTTTEAADLQASISGTTAAPGSPASFQVSVINNGPQGAGGVTASVQLPAGLTAYGPVTASGGSYNNATGLVTYPGFTALSAGNSGSSTISFTMPATGVVPATISVSTTTPESNYANNTASATLVPTVQLDLATTISGPTTAVAGSPITLNVTTTNNGPQAATGALQTVELPQGLTSVYISNSGYYNATASAVTGNFVGGNFVAAAGGSITIAPGTVAFPPTGTLPAGQTIANTITFNSPASAVGSLTYSPVARVAVQPGETSTTNNVAYLNGAASTTTGIVTPTAAPTATVTNVFAILNIKSVTLPDGTTPATVPAVVPSGSKVTYKAGVGNGGTGSATNTAIGVTQQLQLVPGLGLNALTVGGATGAFNSGTNTITFGSGATASTYSTTTGLLTFPTQATLLSDSTNTRLVVLTLPATVANDGSLLATMSVGSATSDKIPSDNVKAVTTRILPTTDLAATVVGPASAVPGQAVSYQVTFANNGPDTATGLTETVQLPAGLGNVTVTDLAGNTVSATYTAATGLLTLPALATDAVGATQSFTVSFAAPAQSYTVGATVGTTSTDTNPANNAATVATAVTPAADVAVSINGPATAVTGNLVSYTVTTTNNGPLPATAVNTTLQLPANLSNVVVSGTGSYASSTGLITFDALPNLPAGVSQVSYVTFTMPDNPTGGQVIGLAKATTTSLDLVASNNSAGIVTSVSPTTAEPLNLTATLPTVPASPATPGTTLSYQVRFSNASTQSVPYVQQQASLPAGLSVAALKVAGQAGTLSAGTGLITFPNSAVYNPTTGTLSFPTGTLAANTNNTYAVSFPAPASGPVVVTATVASAVSESTIADNQASNTTNITPSYDATTSLSGPTTAQPGAAVTYAVTTTNGGPSADPSITQTVTLPTGLTTSTLLVAGQTGTQAGSVITYSNTGATYNTGTGVLTFPDVTFLAAGAANSVTNSFTVSMPASGSLPLTARVVSAGESNLGNNTAALTTTAGNRPPVAQNIVNSLQSARANNADALPISPLNATDPDGTVASYTLTSLPTTAQGTLYYNGGLATTATGLVTNPALLSFKPTVGFVGNAFFTYLATDNLSAISAVALYTLPVAADVVSTYAATPVKGGISPYNTNDVITYLIDPNGAVYNSTGLVYNPDGTAATKTGNLPLSNGLVSAVAVPGAGPTGNLANTLAPGLSLNPTTGQIYVSNPSLLPKVGATYLVNITTVDIYGGTNVVTESYTLGTAPLPVSLTVFTAQAVRNQDGLLKWTTASETDNDHFDVERSLDGTNFTKIGVVAGQGTKLTPTNYTLTDAGVAAKAIGLVYYRLRQVDLNGTATYSPVRSISFTAGEPSISLYPNPTANGTDLDLTQLPSGTYQVTIIDATGRLVQRLSLDAGLLHALDLQNLAAGTYNLLVQGTSTSGTSIQLVKRLIKL